MRRITATRQRCGAQARRITQILDRLRRKIAGFPQRKNGNDSPHIAQRTQTDTAGLVAKYDQLDSDIVRILCHKGKHLDEQ